MAADKPLEPRWHAAIAVALALALYVSLPPKIVVGPYWLLPLLVLVILVPLLIAGPRRHGEQTALRIASIAHIALLNGFNLATIGLLLSQLLSAHRRHRISGEDLLLAAVEIWLTNVLIYGLWYWEFDGGGPGKRAHEAFTQPPKAEDFLFPQMALSPELRRPPEWRPRFIDYVFLSFNTATAFSPTDTYPLTPLGKLLMMGESLTSLVTVAIVAGRAINILG